MILGIAIARLWRSPGHLIHGYRTCGELSVEGLTFRDSCSPLRMTDFCDDRPYAVAVRDCAFLANGYGDCAHEGAAIRAREPYDSGSTLLVENCTFEDNTTSTGEGGAIYCAAILTVRNSSFIGNTSAGLFSHQLVAEGCLFGGMNRRSVDLRSVLTGRTKFATAPSGTIAARPRSIRSPVRRNTARSATAS